MSNIKAIQTYLKSDTVIQRFEELIGKNQAMSYITSVLLVVANNNKLQECTPESIYTSAIRAATLRLSCDPGTKQAYLVPYKDKCTLIVGYKGLYDMAVRTNKYRYINVGPIYEGEIVVEDRITGFHHLEGTRTGSNIIGYIGAFEHFQGYAKTFYMTVDEIDAHAQRYSKSYAFNDSPWKTATEQMRRKTVLRRMLDQWGYLDPIDAQLLHQIDENGIEETITPPVIVDAAPSGNGNRSPEEIINDLGYDTPQEAQTDEAQVNEELGYDQFEEEAIEDPHADLDEKAQSDPSTAFWTLVKRIKMKKSDAEKLVLDSENITDAYQKLREQQQPG